MKYLAIAAFAILLASVLPAANAQNIKNVDITADIKSDGSVEQTAKFYFRAPLSGSVNYTLKGTVRNIRVSGDNQQLDYRFDNGTIGIFLKEPASSVTIIYTADDVVFRSESVSHFFTEFNFVSAADMSMLIKLPEGYGIYQNSYRPASAEIGSDGMRISLQWNETSVKNIFFSVKYKNLAYESSPTAVILVVFLAAVGLLFLHFRKKNREAFFKGFREDEKKAIEYLEQRKVALQSDLQKEFKFSRAKATRIVMRLEEKGLARKQRYGRTNRLFWVKRSLIGRKKEQKNNTQDKNE